MTADSDPLDDAATLAGLLNRRYSCRSYRPGAVEPQVLDRMFRLAQRSASWCNTQPWLVTLTRGAATPDFARALSEHVATAITTPHFPPPEAYVDEYAARRRAAGYALYESVGIAREDRAARHAQMMRNYSFFGAPHVAIISTDRSQGVYGAVDCGGYVSVLMLAATALGLGTIAQASIAMYGHFVREYFDLPDDRMILCAVSIGYPDHDAAVNRFRTERAATADVVTVLG